MSRIFNDLAALSPEQKITAAASSVTIAGLTLVENRERLAMLYAERNGLTIEAGRVRVEVANRILLLLAEDILGLDS